MRYTIIIASLLLASLQAHAQVILDRQLIGSAALEFSSTDFLLSASIGEAITTTEDNNGFVITQGFQQPNYVLSNPFILTLTSTPAACLGANDGSVSIDFLSDNLTPPLTYNWSDGSSAPQIIQAEAGVYSLTVSDALGDAVTSFIRVGVIDSVDCTPGFYSGITPNGDGFNDYWHIDNADFFQEKVVDVYNRYGGRVWNTEQYDNLSSAFIGQHNNGNNLPDGTYFYVAKFDGSTFSGWIEISR